MNSNDFDKLFDGFGEEQEKLGYSEITTEQAAILGHFISYLENAGLLMVWQPIESAPKGKHDVFLVGGETETPCVVVNTSESYPMYKDYPFHTYYGAHPLPKDKFTRWMLLPKGDA